MGVSRPIKEAAEQASDGLQGGARRLQLFVNGFLYDYECDNCGAVCEADVQYVGEQAMHVEVWACPECNSRYYRED